jgi:hypothetical protein
MGDVQVRPLLPVDAVNYIELLHGIDRETSFLLWVNIDDLDVRVIHAATGELIRTLTINPERRYHGTGNPSEDPNTPANNTSRTPNAGPPVSDPRDITWCPRQCGVSPHRQGMSRVIGKAGG